MDLLGIDRNQNLANDTSISNKILTQIKRWWRNYRTRKQLRHLSKHLRQDLGLTERQVHQESRRSFWDN